MRILFFLSAIFAICLSATRCDTLQNMVSTQKVQSSSLVVLPTFTVTINVESSRIKNMGNVSIYLLDLDVFRQCGCPGCFPMAEPGSVPGEDCDDQVLSDLKNTAGLKIALPGKPVKVPQGDYYLLITEKINNVERPVWSTKKPVAKEGEVFLVKIP